MAAVAAGALFIIIDLVALVVFGFGASLGQAVVPFGLSLRSAVAPVAGALLLMGLVALYADRPEATGIPGLAGFLVAFLGMVLAQSFALADLLANLGWALFGAAILQARVYPRAAAILLIVGAVSAGAVSALPRGGPPASILIYAAIAASVILNVAIAWLGFDLFRRRKRRVVE